uniref:Heterogeneous nuclear ribonucleoprotein L-like protein n=1 Tax=Lygus hesperus TaxID=30085 RepID=A0A0A9Z1J4_LYGHE
MAKVARIESDFTPVASEQEYQYEVALKRKIAGNTPPNHILLLTVINPFYPISVNVVYAVCKSFGKILRIVVFRKNGVQSMVEFESIEVAEKGKADLDDKEIYTGCCRLKVEFAKPMRLNVVRNNSDTWDYTKESAPEMIESSGSQPGSGLLGVPPADVVKQEYVESEQISTPAIAIAYPAVEFYDPMSMKYDDYTEYGSVVMAYNLDERMNPDGCLICCVCMGTCGRLSF